MCCKFQVFMNWNWAHTKVTFLGKQKLSYFLIRFLVRWSLSGLLFLLFSIYHVSIIFLFSNYCNFMWFIKLRASAGMCVVFAGVRWCVWVCAGVHMCAQVRASIYTCTWVDVVVHTCTWVYAGVSGCVLVCAGVWGMRRCAWVCMEVWGSAQVSASVCVGWIFRISSGD